MRYIRYLNVAGSDKKLRSSFNVKKGYNLILNLCAASIKKKFIINEISTKHQMELLLEITYMLKTAKIHLLSADLVLKKKFSQHLIVDMVMVFLY